MKNEAIVKRLKWLIGILLLVGMMCIISTLIGGDDIIGQLIEMHHYNPTGFWISFTVVIALLFVEVELLYRSEKGWSRNIHS